MTGEIEMTLGECADKLYELREQRYSLGREIKAIEEQESIIKNHLIDVLSKDDASGVSGNIANVRIKTEDTPIVEDWQKFYEYVASTNSFDMLQKRINTKAITDRVEDSSDFATAAGIGSFKKISVSITKL